MIRIVIPGAPQAKQRPRFGQSRAYTASKTRAYESTMAKEAFIVMRGKRMLFGALRVAVTAIFPIPVSWSKVKQREAATGTVCYALRPDWDNLAKTMDALNKIVWRDDAQIVDGRVIKRYGDNPRLEIEIEEIA